MGIARRCSDRGISPQSRCYRYWDWQFEEQHRGPSWKEYSLVKFLVVYSCVGIRCGSEGVP